MERLTEKNPSWFIEELYVDACKPSDNDIESLYRKLKRYEDLQEQGRLVELPCKVGQSLYTLLSPPHYKRGMIYEYKVVFIGINDSEDMGYGLFNVKSVKGDWMYPFNFSDIGKTVFLTKEEAEQALTK